MTMRKRAGSVLFTGAAAAAIVAMSVGPALASTTLTVKVSHGGSYTASAKTTTLTDNTKDGPIAVTCSTVGKTPSSKATGKLSNGTHHGKNQVKLGTVSKLAFNNCTGPLQAVTTKVSGKPVLNADSKTNSKGDTDAIITGVKVSVSMEGCSFIVTGSAPGYYSNKTHTLYMTPKKLPVKPLAKAQLKVSGVTGNCVAVNNGDHPTYLASYKLSRSIVIKSS
ncbi:MAG TPA: hypothetical protein VMA73_12000 [Streptosporangiaceae bacterium]|nr:hypothetical protein [Streptosporangiaceae bacterium]